MYIKKINCLDLYCLLTEKEYLTNEDLYISGYRDKDIEQLKKSKSLMEIDNKYYVGNLNELNYYVDVCLKMKQNAKASKLFKKCMEIDSNFKTNIYELFSIAVKFEDYDAAIEYFPELEKTITGSYGQTKNNNIILYLLSIIKPLPSDLRDKAKSITLDDITFGYGNSNNDITEINNDYRTDIFKQKMPLATKKINKKCIDNNRFTPHDILLKSLCEAANNKKIEIEEKLFDLINQNNVNGAIKYLDTIQCSRTLGEHENNIKKILHKYRDIIGGEIPEVKYCSSFNTFRALAANDYDLALKINKHFTNSNYAKDKNVFQLILSKIVDQLKLDPVYNRVNALEYKRVFDYVMPFIENTLNTLETSLIPFSNVSQRANIYNILESFTNIEYYDLCKGQNGYIVIKSKEINLEHDSDVMKKYSKIADSSDDYKAENYYKLALISLSLEDYKNAYKNLLLAKNSKANESNTKKHIVKLMTSLEEKGYANIEENGFEMTIDKIVDSIVYAGLDHDLLMESYSISTSDEIIIDLKIAKELYINGEVDKADKIINTITSYEELSDEAMFLLNELENIKDNNIANNIKKDRKIV